MKRIVLAAVLAAVAAQASAQTPAPAAPAAPAAPLFDTTRIDEGVYRFRYQGHNALFVVSPQGVIATDPISLRRPQAAQAYMAEIRKITPAPIRYLVYSHTHYDHATGGKVFKDAGATVVAHRLAKERLLKISNPDLVLPDETVDDRRTLTIGDKRLDLLYMGRNHSDNALVMLLPKEKILFAADWVGTAPNPAGFGPDTWPDEWVEGLNKVLALDWDRLVLGHGNAIGTKDDVRKQIAFLNDAKAAAKGLADGGRCTADGRAATALPASYAGFAQPVQWDTALTRYCVYWNQGY